MTTSQGQQFLEAMERGYDHGDVVIPTGTLLDLINRNKMHRNRVINLDWLTEHVDDDGWHIAENVLLHNESEWRLRIYVKVKESMEPVVVWQDVSLDDWPRLRDGFARSLDVLREKYGTSS